MPEPKVLKNGVCLLLLNCNFYFWKLPITFKKDRNLEDIDRKWLTLFLENMHFNHIKIENNLNNTLVLKLLINFKIDKKRLKMFYSICKNILEEMQNYSSDVYETSIHYYKILKKCQIMLK